MDRIKVVIFEPGKPGKEEFIPNTLYAMQQIVGGYIESLKLTSDTVIICNEEGRLLGLPENRLGIVGTFFIAGDDGGDELISLNDEQVMFLTGKYAAVTVESHSRSDWLHPSPPAQPDNPPVGCADSPLYTRGPLAGTVSELEGTEQEVKA